jgi:hypothetical protein
VDWRACRAQKYILAREADPGADEFPAAAGNGGGDILDAALLLGLAGFVTVLAGRTAHSFTQLATADGHVEVSISINDGNSTSRARYENNSSSSRYVTGGATPIRGATRRRRASHSLISRSDRRRRRAISRRRQPHASRTPTVTVSSASISSGPASAARSRARVQPNHAQHRDVVAIPTRSWPQD